MKNIILKILATKKGRLASGAAAFVVAWATHFLASHNFTLSGEMENLITTGVFFGGGWLIDAIALQINANGVRKIQDALPPSVVSDGVAGPVTIAAVEKASEG